MANRRFVSNEEFNLNYFGGQDETSQKAAAVNRAVIRAVLKDYRRTLSWDELQTCGMEALWECLQEHDPSYGQKLTTSLHQFTRWRCIDEVRKRNRWFKHSALKQEMEAPSPAEQTFFIRDSLKFIKNFRRASFFRSHYVDGKSISDIASERGVKAELVRQEIGLAIVEIRKAVGVSDAAA